MNEIILVILGAAVCLLGFTSRPRSLSDLLRPHIVVPIMLWFGTFFQWVKHTYWGVADDLPIVGVYRTELASDAMLYVIGCLMMFWVGYILPVFPRQIQRLSLGLEFTFQSDRFGRWALALTLGNFACFLLVAPTVVFNGQSGGPLAEVPYVHYLVWVVGPLLYSASAAMLGFSWPSQREERTPGHYGLAFVILVLGSLPAMTRLGRGAGLLPLVAVLAYALRTRRVPRVATAVAGYLALLGNLAALTGRGTYGRSASALQFLGQAVSSMFDYEGFLSSATGSADSLSPLTVVMKGIASGNTMNAMAPLRWFWLQIPIPSALGLSPEWTFFPAIFLAGPAYNNLSTCGYNPTIFGDTYGHFGAAGIFCFIYVGIIYRVIDRLVSSMGDAPESFNASLVLLPTSYVAVVQAMFTNFRAWNALAGVPLVLLLVVAYVRGRVRRQHEELLAEVDVPA